MGDYVIGKKSFIPHPKRVLFKFFFSKVFSLGEKGLSLTKIFTSYVKHSHSASERFYFYFMVACSDMPVLSGRDLDVCSSNLQIYSYVISSCPFTG